MTRALPPLRRLRPSVESHGTPLSTAMLRGLARVLGVDPENLPATDVEALAARQRPAVARPLRAQARELDALRRIDDRTKLGPHHELTTRGRALLRRAAQRTRAETRARAWLARRSAHVRVAPRRDVPVRARRAPRRAPRRAAPACSAGSGLGPPPSDDASPPAEAVGASPGGHR